MAKLKLEIITPTATIFEGDVDIVHLPGAPFYAAAAMLFIALVLAQRAAKPQTPPLQT